MDKDLAVYCSFATLKKTLIYGLSGGINDFRMSSPRVAPELR